MKKLRRNAELLDEKCAEKEKQMHIWYKTDLHKIVRKLTGQKTFPSS